MVAPPDAAIPVIRPRRIPARHNPARTERSPVSLFHVDIQAAWRANLLAGKIRKGIAARNRNDLHRYEVQSM